MLCIVIFLFLLLGQCLWFPDDMKRISNVVDVCKKIFAVTDYASAALPSYISLGLVLNGKYKVYM